MILKNSSHQVESPLVLDQGTQHLLCSCMYMCLLHVDTCAPSYREGKTWNTRQSSPESWPTYLVSSRLIIQLVQGRSDTVKSITTQFGHWWFIRYKQIYCHYTSNFHHIIGENYSFYSPRSRNSHFHHINSAKYHTFHIYTIYKLFKNSRKQHISYLLKNHCFWHFSPFWHFSRSAKITQFQENLKNTIFYYFPIRWRQYDFPHFYLIPQNTQKWGK